MLTAAFHQRKPKPLDWWTRLRIENGLRRYARDLFSGNEKNLPQNSYAYRTAIPENQKEKRNSQRLYPSYIVILRHFDSLLDAWKSLGFDLELVPVKTKAAEIAGKQFGWLTAIKYARSAPGSGRIWLCKCKCGKECFVSVKNLVRGRQVSCGCYRRTVIANEAGEKLVKDISGQRFGRLRAIEIVGKYGKKQSERLWKCICDCGNEVEVPVASLTSRGVRSCGCLRDEARKNRGKGIWKRKNTKFIYFWRVRVRLPERFGEPCAVLIRGKMNNCLVQFPDGYRVITSRNYIRRWDDELKR